ncbi:MAG: hypothetical protein JST00_42125 [Deltaproteobacteria bacterium]|nr:hypothetical protein [Deltaproteobacteria bacterium]
MRRGFDFGFGVRGLARILFGVFAVAAFGACSEASGGTPSGDAEAPVDGSTTSDGGSGGDASGPGSDVRGKRYCEILLVTLSDKGAHVDVYMTFGLNDCPDATFKAIDPAKVATQEGVTRAILNGPRYWTLDRFVTAAFIDGTTRVIAGLETRKAGAIDLPLSAISPSGATPYTARSVQRTTTVQFEAGKPVYELVGPDGKVYDMQSYSVQKAPATEADLATLGSRLSLPSGWSFRTRTLTAPLQITAVGGIATIVQDELENSYQLSSQ